MADTSVPEELAEELVVMQTRESLADRARELTQNLINRSLESPLGFISALAALLVLGSFGFLIAVVVMPWWMYRRRKYMGAFGG